MERHLVAGATVDVVELMYLGFFTLPIMAAVLPHAWRLLDGISRRGWLLFAVWQAILLVGVTALWVARVRMPYIPQFFGSGGLGAPDVLGSRPDPARTRPALGADRRLPDRLPAARVRRGAGDGRSAIAANARGPDSCSASGSGR